MTTSSPQEKSQNGVNSLVQAVFRKGNGFYSLPRENEAQPDNDGYAEYV